MAKKVRTYDDASVEAIQDESQIPADVAHVARELGVTDASETLIFARQLETIKRQVYETKFVELKGRQFVPFSFEGGDLSEYLTYRVWTGTTIAKLVTNYATDFPLVASSAKEVTVKYHSFGHAYGYSLRDMRLAAAANVPLDSQLAKMARKGHELAMDDAVAYGVPQVGTYGLLNHPNISLGTVTNGTWASATGVQMLEDLNSIITQMQVNTSEIFSPNTILMSITAFRKISTKLLDSSGSSMTVLQAFQAQNPGVTVASWSKLALANAGGTNGRIIAFKKDPEVLQFEVGKEFEVLPSQNQNLMMTFPCESRFAGLSIRHPLAVMHFDNQTM